MQIKTAATIVLRRRQNRDAITSNKHPAIISAAYDPALVSPNHNCLFALLSTLRQHDEQCVCIKRVASVDQIRRRSEQTNINKKNMQISSRLIIGNEGEKREGGGETQHRHTHTRHTHLFVKEINRSQRQ